MEISKLAVALPIFLVLSSVSQVDGIRISVGGDAGSISQDISLADETSLKSDIRVLDDAVLGSLHASGSGHNVISNHASGPSYAAVSVASTDGAFSLSSASLATGQGSQISGDLDCTGSARFMASGAAGNDAAAQMAAVDNGVLSSSQKVLVGGGALASQGTEIHGGAGTLVSGASSGDNLMVAEGGFSGGDGKISAQLASASSGHADGGGNAEINGIKCLDSGLSQGLGSDGLNMEVEGLSAAKDGTVGQFGFSVTNVNKADVAVQKSITGALNGGLVSTGAHPEIVQNPSGNPNSFVASNRRIDQSNPLQLYLKTDAALAAKNLDPAAANQAVSLAANTWDYWTKPGQNNLFRTTVINDASKKADAFDGYSEMAFLPISGGALAYTRVYTKPNGIVTEADVCFNTNIAWTTDWDTAAKSNCRVKDFQTVALHELGHATGLGDLYTLPATDARRKDYSEAMNLYSGPRHSLGAGDIRGLQSMYGA